MTIVKKSKTTSAERTPPAPEAAKPAPEASAPHARGTDRTDASGGALMAALLAAATKRGHNLADLAKALGVTYGYLVQLRAGSRPSARISDDFAARCALYIGLPRLSVLLLAGRITQADFFEASATSPKSLAMAYDYIRNDPRWGARVPVLTEEEMQRSKDLVFVVIWFYQEMRDVDLLFGVDDECTFWPVVDEQYCEADVMDVW